MKEIKVAIIGGGHISHRHMQIYENIQRIAPQLGFTAKVVAVAEINPQRLKAWGERYKFKNEDLYIDFREMLKRDDIDTVDVCVHNNLHTPVSIAALKAGYDVYCEKPLAASYHDGKMIVDCAKKLGRKFHVQMSSLMNAQTRMAKEYIQNGKIGTPYFVNLEQCAARRRPGYDPQAREFTSDFNSREIAGHGPSIDLGVYVIGQILYVLGEPKLKSVSGFATRGVEIDERMLGNADGFGVEDICNGLAKFENGVAFHYLATSACNYKDYGMTYILGSKGGLEVVDADTVGGKLSRPAGARRMWGQEPGLKFFGSMPGSDALEVEMNLRCDENSEIEKITNPGMMLYNDNQIMWLAYKLGILTDETRYNTPDIALQQLLFTDGIFLSQELGREVTVEEIIAKSPAMYIKQQKIGNELVTYDTSF